MHLIAKLARAERDAGQVDDLGVTVVVLVEALPQVDLGNPSDVVRRDAVALEQFGQFADRHRRARLLGQLVGKAHAPRSITNP